MYHVMPGDKLDIGGLKRHVLAVKLFRDKQVAVLVDSQRRREFVCLYELRRHLDTGFVTVTREQES